MYDLSDSELYNIGLAFYTTSDNKQINATDVMDSETEEKFWELCKKDNKFEEEIENAVAKCKSEYSEALSIKDSDFQNSEEFFEEKNAAEEKVIVKLKIALD